MIKGHGSNLSGHMYRQMLKDSSLERLQALNVRGVSKSYRTGRLERELQMVQLSATRCSFIAILWVSLASFAATTICVASQIVFVVITLSIQSGNFWIYSRIPFNSHPS
jgi:hypothetical protein